MALKRAGFFRELTHGDPEGPSIQRFANVFKAGENLVAARYLSGGAILATTGTFVDDYFEPSHTSVAPADIRTDGVWVWPADLAYYVEKYSVLVPEDFLLHMRTRISRLRS